MIKHRDVWWIRILFTKPHLTQVVGYEVQVLEAWTLTGDKTINGSWSIDVVNSRLLKRMRPPGATPRASPM